MLTIRKTLDEPMFGQKKNVEQPAVEEGDTGMKLGLLQSLYVEISEPDHGLMDRFLVLEDLSWI
jgi:hypothetical protein